MVYRTACTPVLHSYVTPGCALLAGGLRVVGTPLRKVPEGVFLDVLGQNEALYRARA